MLERPAGRREFRERQDRSDPRPSGALVRRAGARARPQAAALAATRASTRGRASRGRRGPSLLRRRVEQGRADPVEPGPAGLVDQLDHVLVVQPVGDLELQLRRRLLRRRGGLRPLLAGTSNSAPVSWPREMLPVFGAAMMSAISPLSAAYTWTISSSSSVGVDADGATGTARPSSFGRASGDLGLGRHRPEGEDEERHQLERHVQHRGDRQVRLDRPGSAAASRRRHGRSRRSRLWPRRPGWPAAGCPCTRPAGRPPSRRGPA